MTDQMFFKLACPWCGTINHEKIPTPAKDDSFVVNCDHCKKAVVEFHWHEVEDEK